MAEAVANVARRVNETVEEGKDCLGKTELFLSILISLVLCIFLYFLYEKNGEMQSQWHHHICTYPREHPVHAI